MKIAEDQEKDKQIVDAQGEFDHISGDKLQRHCTPVPEKDNHGKNAGERNPHHAEGNRFPELYGVRAAVKDAEVEYQHRDHKQVEQYPERELVQWRPQKFDYSELDAA